MGNTSMAATQAAVPTETVSASASAARIIVLLLLPFALTYIWTVAGNRGYRHESAPREPPRVPYWIPVAGNTFGFAFNTEKFLTSIICKFGNVPLRILVGAEPMYFIPHGEPILELFKASRHLTTKSLGVMTVRDAFGCPQKDIDDIYGADDSGTEAKPAPGWENVDPSLRFHFIQHRDIHTFLTGSSLNAMTTKFVEVYSERIEKDTRFKHDEWTEIDDLYAWLKDGLIRAAIEALCGEKFLELAPDFPDDFWAFDYHLPNMFKRLPRWLVPKSYQARDKVHEAVLQYHKYGRTQFDFTDDEVLKRDWTPEFGARLMCARQKMFANTGFSAHGAAALDLGMMWAVNANAIPVVGWMMLGILLDNDIKGRVMAEIEPTFHENSLSFDINRLCAGPLLNSIYCETLRVRVAAPVGRASLIPNLKFGKWQMRQGVGMLSTSWVGGHDETFWNVGRVFSDGSSEHPVDSFWAERFLQYQDDPTSGPIRKHYEKATIEKTPKKRTAEDDRNARVVTEGIQGHWYPYGGGTKMCPGRFFAKQELMAGVSVVLRAFEIELLDHGTASKVQPNMDYFPFGTIPLKGKVGVRIKRRKL